MVGLRQSLEGLRGKDMERVLWALHGKVFSNVYSTCKGAGVPRVEIGDDDST